MSLELESLVREQEFARWLNAHPEASRRHAWEAAWNAAIATVCSHCFCRAEKSECCYCGRKKNGT